MAACAPRLQAAANPSASGTQADRTAGHSRASQPAVSSCDPLSDTTISNGVSTPAPIRGRHRASQRRPLWLGTITETRRSPVAISATGGLGQCLVRQDRRARPCQLTRARQAERLPGGVRLGVVEGLHR